MQPGELNMTTEVVGHARFLFLRLPPPDPELAAAVDALGAGMENMQDAEGAPDGEALRRGRFQLLRGGPAPGDEPDLPDPGISGAGALVRLEGAAPAPLERYEAGLRALLGPRGGAVAAHPGVQRPRSYTSHAMTQFAYADAAGPGPASLRPLGVVTPQNKTEAWWRMDWMRRETFFLPRYDEAGRMVAKGHALAAEAGIPRLTRRLVHRPGGYLRAEGYDFIGYFEFAEADAPTFREVMAALRDPAQNPEWRYVREGPEWWGRRVGRAEALWA